MTSGLAILRTMNRYCLLSVTLVSLWAGMGQAISQTSKLVPVERGVDTSRNVFFRTKSYVVQIVWRAEVPYMTVSSNGFRVLVDARSHVVPARGSADNWTTYAALSGDYRANVRVSPTGQRAIEITLGNNRLKQEYAIGALGRQPTLPKTAAKDGTLLAFETAEYVVRIFKQQERLLLNLYNKQTAKTDVSQALVVVTNTSEGTVYRHDGQATIQAREDLRGGRSLLIMRDNAIQYRGEAF